MDRIYHTWDKWECYPAGFYETKPPKYYNQDQCHEVYRALLSNVEDFVKSLDRVISEWVNSCEHYLTNEKMNRIAWLGQAALCITHGIPSRFRGGYNLLDSEQQEEANKAALDALNRWLSANGYEETDMIGAGVKSKVNLY